MEASPKYKIYVVNLERATTRRKFILRQFRKLGIENYTFISALDAAKMGEPWLQQQIDHAHLVRPLRPAEIACALSHKIALEHFLGKPEIGYAVVLEDDVLLSDNFEQQVRTAIAAMKDDEIVMLSGSLHTRQQFRSVGQLDTHTRLVRSVRPIEQIYTTAAYIMPREVAAKHIHAIYPITDVADSWWYYKGKGAMRDILLAYPFPVKQEVFQSTRGSKAKIYKLINWIIYHKLPLLYQFFTERRGREERKRLLNIELVDEQVE